jgi:DNA-binding NarL/FixJ family response regulator
MSNKEIAAELVIAENTVRNHVRNILEKFDVRSRVEAAMYAVREKLVDAP